jgi:hypothetical protein
MECRNSMRRWFFTILVACGVTGGCGGQTPLLTPVSVFEPTTVTTPDDTGQPFRPSSGEQTPLAFDYRRLLLQPEDIAQLNAGYSVPSPPTLNPDGVPGAEGMLTSNDATSAIGITIVILGDASAAAAALPEAVENLTTVVAAEPPSHVTVGDEAVAVRGTTPDGMKSATALVFHRSRALVRIDFYGLPGMNVSPEVVVHIGQMQAAVLRAGLDVSPGSR